MVSAGLGGAGSPNELYDSALIFSFTASGKL